MKKSRSAYGGAITRVLRRHEKLLDADPSTFDIATLKRQMESVQATSESFIQVHQNLLETHATEVDDEQEMRTLDSHEESVALTLSILQRLVDLKSVHMEACNFDEKLANLEAKIATNPELSYPDALKKLENTLAQMEKTVNQSTIPRDHRVSKMVRAFDTRMLDLSASEARASPADVSISSSTTSDHHHHHIKLPKLAVPTFNGDILKWAVFWERFSSIIHDNPKLDNHEKLTYLRQAITDPDASQLLSTTTIAPGQYDELVDTLQKRYDKKRIIHQHHVMALINCQAVKHDTHKELCAFIDTFSLNIRALENAKQFDAESILTSIATSKLPKVITDRWSLHTRDTKDVPKVKDLLAFLTEHANSTATASNVLNRAEMGRDPARKPKAAVHVSQPSTSRSNSGACSACKGDCHSLYYCTAFMAMSLDDKQNHVRKHNVCSNCLTYGHRVKDCRSLGRCKKCHRNHHTILHRESAPVLPTEPQAQAASSQAPGSSSQTQVASSQAPGPSSPAQAASSQGNQAQQMHSVTAAPIMTKFDPTIHMTAVVTLESSHGRKLRARAFLDTGSHLTIMTRRAAQLLQLHLHPEKLGMAGVGDVTTCSSHSSHVFLSTAEDATPLFLKVFVLPKVTGNMPAQTPPPLRHLPHLQNLPLADPQFDQPGKIDLLIGNDALQDIIMPEFRRGAPSEPVAIKTVYGWAILGRLPSTSNSATSSVNVVSPTPTSDDLLTRFWETEEVSTAPVHTSEEKVVQEHFISNHVFLSQGLYQVTLPRKADAPVLGESRSQALRCLKTNEQSLLKKGMWQQFQDVVKEYMDLGHAEPVPDNELKLPDSRVYYMPMHSVVKQSSSTTKLRVVFDASAKTSSGHSFNDTLAVGPTLYPPITDILMKFRTYPIALSGDISKMYRAIQLSPEDRNFHRFLWRQDISTDPSEFRMTRVTFGVAASPFAAIRTLQQVAADFGADYPLASPHVSKSFYVDDFLAGAQTTEEAISLQEQLRTLLLKGGFQLRKWRSNSEQVMDTIPTDLHEPSQQKMLNQDTASHPKALGIHWDAQTDSFFVSIGDPAQQSTTKRSIISDIARTFDVLGWLAPATVKMKMLFQRLWELKLDWDQEVPPEVQECHHIWRSELSCFINFPVARCYFRKGEEILQTELHGFADASENAYAAVVYLRTTYAAAPPTMALVTAKTKVAPLKQLSIPRLELCAAHLLAKLLTTVGAALHINLSNTYAWSDSTIVLYWLDGNPRRLKTFVGNRVANILEVLPPTAWRHVPSQDNPADCASRGMFPQELLQHQLWWTGPSWLLTDPPQLPTQPLTPPLNIPEVKAICLPVNIAPHMDLEERFSCFDKLVRVTAWMLRFIERTRKLQSSPSPNHCSNPFLTASEIKEAELLLISRSQRRSFPTELQRLQSGKTLKPSSCIASLSPTIRSGGLIVMGGRLQNSALATSQRHPIILSGKDLLTRLIVTTKHLALLHAGPTLLMAATAANYHIIGARRLIRTTCRSCITCRKTSAITQQQMMGQLPASRVTPSAPFNHTGMDFAGPFIIKKGHTRRPVYLKAYACLFVCFSTKAVHIELVSDLTSEAFLAALKRFVARRGCPTHLQSDNGSNFVGANNILKDIYALLSEKTTQTAITSFATSQRIEWHFSPEKAPHFGGLWEAAVKSAKFHLKRVVGEQRLTFEELTTVLCQVECCLNSRPLVPLQSHSDDGIDVLTPGHFLIGRNLQALPEIDLTSKKLPLLRRWSLLQAISQHFWRRWSTEYLQQLQRFNKWRTPTANLQVDDIVLIKEDGLVSNSHWPMGKIVRIYPGKDGHVRVVAIKTKTGTYKRPTAKIVRLISQEP